MIIEVCEDCPYNTHPCPEGCSKKIQDKPMTPTIHFLENKFKIALTEKPKMELYGWLSQSSFDGEESGWCLEGGEDAYYEALKINVYGTPYQIEH